MKGRNNYLCRKKLYDLTDQPVLSGLEEIEQYRAIAAWEKTTATGDRAELAELPETSALWHKLDARTDACIGQKCSEWERCFITEMRRRGWRATLLSSTIICSSPILPSSCRPRARPTRAFCPKRQR
jgi:ATP-dependent DNA helicase DinG